MLGELIEARVEDQADDDGAVAEEGVDPAQEDQGLGILLGLPCRGSGDLRLVAVGADPGATHPRQVQDVIGFPAEAAVAQG